MKRISKVLIFSWALTVLLSFNVYAKANEQYSNNGTILHYVLEDGNTAPEHWEKKNGTWYYYSENNIAFKDTVIAAYDDKYYAFDKNGAMLASTETEISGIPYIIDSHGDARVKLTDSEKELEEYAKELADKLTAGLSTDEEKVTACFKYAYNLRFDANAIGGDGSNIQDAAAYAFDTESANCFGQASVFHYLCQAIGIKDMIIHTKDPRDGYLDHWWNLIKIGDQYRHVDCTPFTGFKGWNQVTTDELESTSASSNETRRLHQFDKNDVPKAF